jgi:histidine ammonia-lyase
MKLAEIKPVSLSYKEGLGLINGSQMFTGCGVLRLFDAIRLTKTAQIASAMTVDALNSPMRAFDSRVHKLRPFNGQMVVAENIRRLVEGSEILATPSGKVQDAYSIRCIPQVIGPTVDALRYIRKQLEIEMNSAADNPLFSIEDMTHLACGNFHGQPIAMALDFLAIAMSELGTLSERHTNRLLNPNLSKLPDFLVEGKGLNSGLMVAQYTAAALACENKILSHPAVVDNFSLAADQEDDVSMGPISERKADEILKNLVNILAIEMMCGAQAIDFREGKKPGRGVRIAYEVIRSVVPKLIDDRVLYPDISAVAEKIRSGEILDSVEREISTLKWEVE